MEPHHQSVDPGELQRFPHLLLPARGLGLHLPGAPQLARSNPVPVARSLSAEDGLLVTGQISADGLSGNITSMTLLPQTTLDVSEGGEYRISFVLNSGDDIDLPV